MDKTDAGGKGGGGGVGSGKTPVIGAVQRKGSIVAKVISSVDAKALLGFVREAVSRKVSLLCTDQWKAYDALGIGYPNRGHRHQFRRSFSRPVCCRCGPYEYH